MNPSVEVEGDEAVVTLGRLVERARGGDRSALPELRAALDGHPELWGLAGDLAAHARESWVDLIAGTDLLVGEAMRRHLDGLEAEQGGPHAHPLVQLLAQRVALTWVQVHHADLAAAAAQGGSAQALKLAGQRQDGAQRRYLQAIAALATVRKLLPAGRDGAARSSPAIAEPASGPAIIGIVGDPSRAGAGRTGA